VEWRNECVVGGIRWRKDGGWRMEVVDDWEGKLGGVSRG